MAEMRMSLGVVMHVYSTLSRLRQEFTTTDSGDRDRLPGLQFQLWYLQAVRHWIINSQNS